MSFYGIKTGIDFAEYRADDITTSDTIETVEGKAISKSLICKFMADPWAWKNSPKQEKTAAMTGGSVLDCLLTEPHEFANRYVMSAYDEFRTNESKAWRAEQEQNGLVVLKQDQFATSEAQLRAIKAKPEAAELINGAQFQVAFRHKTAYPFASKGLIDILPDDGETIVDLKLVYDPKAFKSLRAMRRYIYDQNHHIGAGGYCEGYAIASGEERTCFKQIMVEAAEPHRVAVVELPFAAISFGSDIYRAQAKRFGECLKANNFPSIWDGAVELDLPEYAYTETE